MRVYAGVLVDEQDRSNELIDIEMDRLSGEVDPKRGPQT